MPRPRKPETPATPPRSGGARLLASGKTPMLLGLTPEHRALIERAARAEDRPMTQFVIRAAVAHAQKIVKKIS